MVPGSPPPVLAVPFVSPSWAAIMTGGYRHHRIRRKLLAYHPPSRKETRRANGTSRRKRPHSCAGLHDGCDAGLHDGPDRPLSGSLYSVLRIIPTRKETRRANHCKTPCSCAGGDPGPGRRPRSAGAPHSTPSRSSYTPSRPYRHNDGYRHGEGGDDDRGRPPPPPPNYPRRNLPDLQIRCHYSDHTGQCENICTLHKGQFRHRVVRKHTTLTFCTANCMGSFLRDERDTLISQPFPPHVRHAAGARLNQRVRALLEGKCPDNQRSVYTWPLRSLLNRTVRMTAGMDLQDISTRAVYTRFLYDTAIDAVNYRADEDRQFNAASVGLLRRAEDVENPHIFRVLCLDANSEFHCDRWGLELTGKSPTKGTYAPAGRAQGKRSNAKRRKDFPNPSVGPSPQFSSASSSSSDPRGPTADVNGQSRGEASSSNFVHPPPASVSTPSWLLPGTHPHHILARRVPTLLKSQRSWRSVSETLDHFMYSTKPEVCHSLVTYLRSCARVGYIPSHELDAIEHATCHGLIYWANLIILINPTSQPSVFLQNRILSRY